MPVTIRPSPDKIGRNTRATVLPSDFLKLQLNRSARGQVWRIGKPRPILHTSFSSPLDDGTPIIPYGNGFIHGAISAFAQDLHLVISPDDVWLAIITQFSFYVNAHAEDLREFFVHHEGKKELVIKDAAASPETLDVNWLALEMAKLIQNELVDPEIKDWLVPDFSTTTNNDRAVASMVLMGTLQKFFDYGCMTKCGLPSVTLLGEKEDWENILARLDRFEDFGDQPKSWVKLLTPILRRFVATFNDPEDEELKNFWLKICHSEAGRGSGRTSVFTGWITGFAYWKSDGTRLIESKWNEMNHSVTTLDNQDYPIIGQSKVPAGVITVPLFIDDLQSRIRINTTIIAGSVGMTLTEEDTKVRPRSGWWMLEDGRVPLES